MNTRLIILQGSVALMAATGVFAPRLIADPPARVGRLNYLDGAVSFRPASIDDWAAAEPNRTITTGDRLWTDVNSRAELHVGSSAVRLGAQTEFDIVNLDDQIFQARLAQGSVTLRIRSVEGGEVDELDTPNGAITFGAAGEYRVDVDESGSRSRLTVWSGGAEVTSAGSSFQVNPHQVATVNGTDAPTYDLTDAGAYDDWDTWCITRDRREDASKSAEYVSREMPGYEDLDEYGHWTVMAQYGNVWVPDHVEAGWAPYHTGHWVWVDPWGWTWVDSAPWGYAPYHYGRWAYAGGAWVWAPGNPAPRGGVIVVVRRRPVFAPALVAFVGGPGWSVSVGVGGGEAVAWVPLGPGEVYRPAYTASPTYVRQVNVTNVTNVTNITNVTNVTNVTNYRNANAPGGVTAVSRTTVASGQSVARSAVPVSREQLATARVVGAAPSVVPTQAGVVGGAQARTAGPSARPPAAVMNRAVVARTPPPPAAVPFARQQSLLATNAGRPLAATQMTQARQTTTASDRTDGLVVKPAGTLLAAGRAGLTPARPGIAAVTPVRGATSTGYVQPKAPAGPPVAQPVVQPLAARGSVPAPPPAAQPLAAKASVPAPPPAGPVQSGGRPPVAATPRTSPQPPLAAAGPPSGNGTVQGARVRRVPTPPGAVGGSVAQPAGGGAPPANGKPVGVAQPPLAAGHRVGTSGQGVGTGTGGAPRGATGKPAVLVRKGDSAKGPPLKEHPAAPPKEQPK